MGNRVHPQGMHRSLCCKAVVCPCAAQGNGRHRGYSLFEENTPFETPRERRGESPSTPALRDLGLKSCSACGIGCLPGDVSKRFGVLLLPAAALPAYRQSSAISSYFGFYRPCRCLPWRHCCARRVCSHYPVEGGRTALTAVCTTENACTVDRRKLVCTDGRYAERQQVIGVGQIVSQHQWRRAQQCRHAGQSHSPGTAPLRAASCQ